VRVELLPADGSASRPPAVSGRAVRFACFFDLDFGGRERLYVRGPRRSLRHVLGPCMWGQHLGDSMRVESVCIPLAHVRDPQMAA